MSKDDLVSRTTNFSADLSERTAPFLRFCHAGRWARAPTRAGVVTVVPRFPTQSLLMSPGEWGPESRPRRALPTSLSFTKGRWEAPRDRPDTYLVVLANCPLFGTN